MIVGPAIPIPITPMWPGASVRAISSRKIAWWLYGAPEPPYSFGHVRPAYPASPSLRLHSRSASSKRRPPRLFDASGRFCAMNSRTSCRKAASSWVSRSSTEGSYAPDDSDPAVRLRSSRSRCSVCRRSRRGRGLIFGADWVQTPRRLQQTGLQGEHILRGTSRAAAALAAVVAFAFAIVGSALAGDVTGHGDRDRLASADVNATPAAQKVLDKRAAQLSTNPPAAAAALKDSLGPEGVVKLDPL